jgi:hypothetical protein
MTSRLPAIVGKLIPRLGSPHDGEVVATARAIERVLRSHNYDSHDVLGCVRLPAPIVRGATGQDDGPPRWADLSDDLRLQWLAVLAAEPTLNGWSVAFIGSIAARIRSGGRLSPKQLGCIDKILCDGWRRGIRPEARRRA